MKSKNYYNNAYKQINFQLSNIKCPVSRDDSDFSDDDFFRYAFKEDILTNALNLVENILFDNIESQGLDNNCRAILEAVAILNLADSPNTYLDNHRKYLFRLSYAPIEVNNNKEAFKQAKDDMNKGTAHYATTIDCFERDTTIVLFKTEAAKCFGCNYDDITDELVGISDLYLRKSLRESIHYSEIVSTYVTCIENSGELYNFFTMMIHPWCENNDVYRKQIFDKREEYIDKVISLVLDFLNSMPLKYVENNIYDFKVTFENLSPYCQIMNNFVAAFSDRGFLAEQNLAISKTIFDSLGYLMKDQFLSLATDCFATVIAKFKSYLEMYVAILYLISQNLSPVDRENKLNGFILSSRIRKLNYDAQNIKHNCPTLYDKTNDLFKNYCKNSIEFSGLKTVDQLIKKMKSSWFYFFDTSETEIDKFVFKMLNEFFNNPQSNDEDKELAKDAYNTYRYSLDIEHACGYAAVASTFTLHNYVIKTFRISLKLLKSIEKINTDVACDDGLDAFVLNMYEFCDASAENFNRLLSEEIKKPSYYKRKMIKPS